MKKKLLTSKQENEQAKRTIIELYELQQNFKKQESEYKQRREELQTSIKNFMFVNGIGGASFIANQGIFAKEESVLNAKVITPCKVEFDADKLEQKLGKEKCVDFICKEYTISDINGLIKYLKSCGVSSKKFKSFINVKKKVDSKKINELSEVGKLSNDDIKGCYELIKGTSYIKINVDSGEK